MCKVNTCSRTRCQKIALIITCRPKASFCNIMLAWQFHGHPCIQASSFLCHTCIHHHMLFLLHSRAPSLPKYSVWKHLAIQSIIGILALSLTLELVVVCVKLWGPTCLVVFEIQRDCVKYSWHSGDSWPEHSLCEKRRGQ